MVQTIKAIDDGLSYISTGKLLLEGKPLEIFKDIVVDHVKDQIFPKDRMIEQGVKLYQDWSRGPNTGTDNDFSRIKK